jgi:hypothetical protein
MSSSLLLVARAGADVCLYFYFLRNREYTCLPLGATDFFFDLLGVIEF